MRRLVLPILILVLLTASSANGASKHKAALTCSLPSGAQMIEADPQAQLYVLPERSAPHGEVRFPEVFGCAFRGKRTYDLGELVPSVGTATGIKGIDLEILSGAVVAYEYSVASKGFKESLVIVRDLRTGRVLHRVPSGPSSPPSSIGVGPVVALVVKSDGAVGWIVESHGEPATEANHYKGTSEYTIFALDQTGTRQVATGKDIDRSSLALAGSTLYWTQNGKPASSALN